MKPQPLGPRVLIREIVRSDVSAGGIITGDADPRHKYGQVEAVGDADAIESVCGRAINVGDTVIVGTYAGVIVEVARTTLLLLQAAELLAIVPTAEPWRLVCIVERGEPAQGVDIEIGLVAEPTINITAEVGVFTGLVELTATDDELAEVRASGLAALELRNGQTIARLHCVETGNLIQKGGRLIARGTAVDDEFGSIGDVPSK